MTDINIFDYNPTGALDDRFLTSIENGFGGRLVDGYKDRDFEKIHFALEKPAGSDILGGYILIPNPFDTHFLSKIWVVDHMKGQGIGRMLWADMIERYPSIFWRSLRSNPACDWYKANCEGYTKYEHRNIYWINPYIDDISQMSLWAFEQPLDIIEEGQS